MALCEEATILDDAVSVEEGTPAVVGTRGDCLLVRRFWPVSVVVMWLARAQLDR